MLLRRIFGLWLLILLTAIINGALGDLFTVRWLGLYGTHVYKTVVVVIVVFVLAGLYARRTRTSRWLQDVTECGLIWVLLTVCFELIFNNYVLKDSWRDLLSNYYDLGKGRLWSLVLLSELLAPFLMTWRLKRKI